MTDQEIKAELPDLLTEDLDDMVHDLASIQATIINESGVDAQLSYLMCNGVPGEFIVAQIKANREGA